MSKPTLYKLGRLHKTDKQGHGYLTIYEKYFEPRRDEKLYLLEIGIQSGRSIAMWRSYFPNARIIGVDKYKNHCANGMKKGATVTCCGDQSDKKFMTKVAKEHGPFDIIIDDAGHFSKQQIPCFKVMWPFVKKKGLYIIEDLDTSYTAKYTSGYRDPTMMEYLKEQLDRFVKGARHQVRDPFHRYEFMHFYNELVIIGKEGDDLNEEYQQFRPKK